MSQVGTAGGAQRLDAFHTKGDIALLGDRVVIEGEREAWPTRSRFVLGFAGKQFSVADSAVIGAWVFRVVILASERSFGARQLGNFVLFWGESLSEFSVVEGLHFLHLSISVHIRY